MESEDMQAIFLHVATLVSTLKDPHRVGKNRKINMPMVV
jgi:hypothetical protein